jgi:hypothetical protein
MPLLDGVIEWYPLQVQNNKETIMTPYVTSTDLLTQDPEAFDRYFSVTEIESRQFREQKEKISDVWRDWPMQEAKICSKTCGKKR